MIQESSTCESLHVVSPPAYMSKDPTSPSYAPASPSYEPTSPPCSPRTPHMPKELTIPSDPKKRRLEEMQESKKKKLSGVICYSCEHPFKNEASKYICGSKIDRSKKEINIACCEYVFCEACINICCNSKTEYRCKYCYYDVKNGETCGCMTSESEDSSQEESEQEDSE